MAAAAGVGDARAMANGEGPRNTPLRRPRRVRIDAGVCIVCGLCDTLVPGLRVGGATMAATEAALEAMAACPVGAVRWVEGERDDSNG